MSVQISDTSVATIGYAVSILRELNTDYSLRLCRALELGTYEEVVHAKQPDPKAYSSSDNFSRDYLAYNLLRKFDAFDLPIDRRAAAIGSFLESEMTCAIVNDCGRMWSPVIPADKYGECSLEAKIFLARKLIRRLLGPFSWDEAARHFRFSAGASTRMPRRTGHPFYKYMGRPHVTRSAALLAVCDIWRTPLWREQMREYCDDPTQWVTIVPGSKADTVPKDSKTDRFICIEPEMNMRLQLGVGHMIRLRLKRVGIDLNDQTRNQDLAFEGSLLGNLATIDLSRASDSIALRLCRDLLPDDWYEAMCRIRSEVTHLSLPEGTADVHLEKVSSMGNGFTFELESLIFWALSQAVVELHGISETRVAVYGDDIVISTEAVEPLLDLLSYVGFTPNMSKSFWDGPFRESCGKHYFLGEDVTPFYIKERIEHENRYYWLLNSYNAWLVRNGESRNSAYNRIYRRATRRFGTLCVVPPGSGYESGLEVPISSARVYFSLRKQAYVYKKLVPVRKRHRPNGSAALLAWLEASGLEPSDRLLWLMRGDNVYLRKNAMTSRWPDKLVSGDQGTHCS